MALSRMATWKRAEQGKAVVLVVDGRKIEVDHAALTTLDTPAKLKAAVDSVAGRPLPVFFHINDDDSLAMAWGAEPDVWPEDYKPEVGEP